jgi:hypothetical protein
MEALYPGTASTATESSAKIQPTRSGPTARFSVPETDAWSMMSLIAWSIGVMGYGDFLDRNDTGAFVGFDNRL